MEWGRHTSRTIRTRRAGSATEPVDWPDGLQHQLEKRRVLSLWAEPLQRVPRTRVYHGPVAIESCRAYRECTSDQERTQLDYELDIDAEPTDDVRLPGRTEPLGRDDGQHL